MITTSVRRRTRRSLATVLSIGVLAAAGPFGTEAGASTSQLLPDPGGQTAPAAWSTIDAAAARQGSVRLIAEIDDAGLPRSNEAARRRGMDERRASLRRELGDRLEGFTDVPGSSIVAFNADRTKIRALKRSRRVRRVTVDREVTVDLERPSGPVETPAPDPASADPAARVDPDTANAASATTSNGSTNQLSFWWDYYRIGVNTSVSKGWNGAGQNIVVIDTGVDRNHAWLSGRVVAEACFAYAQDGRSGACPGGRASLTGIGAAAPCTFDFGCAHGTHVAHTAAGSSGVAPGARIIAVQIFRRGANGQATYWESDLVNALQWVYNQRSTYRIAAVNMSLGGGGYQGYCDNVGIDGSTNATYVTGWINTLKSAGIASVVASGNDDFWNGMRSPGCITNAVSVGNTTLDTAGNDAVFGYVKGGSNTDRLTLDLLAPGTDICSAVPTWLDNDGTVDGIGCGWTGTSMASPHVAGAFAVLRQKRPTATVDQIQARLRATGLAVVDSRHGYSTPRIHVWGAVNGF